MTEQKPRLAISFSGGRSSAVMMWVCLQKYAESHKILITFANTGCEDNRTLDFVRAADEHLTGNRVVWIEAVINGAGVGPTAKVVTYETAARNGEPFADAIKKHGVFCKTHPQCTSRLKEEPMISYRRSVGWEAGSYDTAIGIRADEIDRCSSKAKEKRFIYPLVDAGWTKRDVNKYMQQFEWDLKLPNDAWGNCVWCWKKSKRKLMTVAKAEPYRFDFPGKMEKLYGHINKGDGVQENPRVFFRENRSTADILSLAQTEAFRPYTDDQYEQGMLFDNELDVGIGCGDSCEIGADE